MFTAAVFFWISTAWASNLDVQIQDMHCTACEAKVAKALDALPFLANTTVSFALGRACAEVEGTVDKTAVVTTLTDLGYTIPAVEETTDCDLSQATLPKNWADTDGLDVKVISWGDRVELSDHRAKDKFTIYDFGAPWCSPCHAAEVLLKQYLQEHADVAVRAIVLNSPDPKTSFNMPAAAQHLMNAPGLPYFIAINPRGKVISRGVDLPKVLKQIDKRR